eukprot:CAMPEP_0194715274 /NCGR_PEP_ID=MMETSP0296-20130528/6989_1 /TAXON_ID=39354 /ORGANISM="Heterosigma akashiwo, Strain CCMP2393" /LENGTH=366 /DNA_ID=CAMNT_0039615007 /DNA_START=98 /DNA_END=1195 /DNA_ORIENTATION=-
MSQPDGTPISSKIVEFGLSWDFVDGMEPVDLDAQAVLFDQTGKVVDCAFYNQLSACNGSVIHSGDNRTGEGDGDDETVTINFESLPQHVKVIAIVVTAYAGGTFQAVETAEAELREVQEGGGAKTVVGDISIGCKGQHTALIFSLLVRGAGGWRCLEVGGLAHGRHFQDCIGPLRDAVDSHLEPDLIGERVLSMERTFEMHKGDTATVPVAVDRVRLGLGWETPNTDLDLDASCLMLQEDCRAQEEWVVSFKRLQLPGVKHSGDNLTGQGAGDDEEITVAFPEVPPNIHHLAFVVNIYTEGRSFAEVFDSYIRMVGPNGHVLARYPLDGKIQSRGLFFAAFSRGGGGGPEGWVFRAVGAPLRGRRA